MAQSRLVQDLTLPSNWSNQCGIEKEFKEVRLLSTSSEYQSARQRLIGIPLTNLQYITRVESPYLYWRYQLRKMEYNKKTFNAEKTLLHATSATKVPSILTNNLDWRMVSRNKFGQGVSFSHSSMYANKECSKYNGHSRAIIIAKVLVHQSHRGSSMTRLPMSGYDTTTDHRGFVTVKYYDDEFYPEYVAYYTNNSFFDLNSLKSSLDF